MVEIKLVALKDIKPNPFKKFINEGRLNDSIIEKLIEGYKQTTFHENICAREFANEIELVYGHHRLEAAKRVYGEDYEINLVIYSKEEFSDEMMLIDMVRENLTHRDVDFQDKKEAVILAYNWLQSNAPTVKRFDNRLKNGTLRGSKPSEDSYRSIAKFLSREGKTISYESVRNYLQMSFDLDKSILEQVTKVPGQSGKKEHVPVWQGITLSTFPDKEEQKDLLKAFQKSREQRRDGIRALIRKYRATSPKIRNKVREQKIDIADIPSAEKDIESLQSMKLERTARNVANDILGDYSHITEHINELVKEMNIRDLDKETLTTLVTSTGVLVKVTLPKLIFKLIEHGGRPDKQILELMKILK